MFENVSMARMRVHYCRSQGCDTNVRIKIDKNSGATYLRVFGRVVKVLNVA